MGDSDRERPGDEAPAEEEAASEDLCPDCSGEGEVDGQTCETCEGTGRIEEGVGGA